MVEMICAQCGCLVDRGIRLTVCDDPACCCKDLVLQSTVALSARVVAALEAADLEGLRELLAPNARWGAPEDVVPTCQNREQVIAWYERARDAGVRAKVFESRVVARNIVVGLRVNGRGPDGSFDDAERWQVLSVRDGLIAEIRGYDDRDEAAASAAIDHTDWDH